MKFEFPGFSLLGEKFGDFWPQIRIPGEKLYIWSNFGQNRGQNPVKLIKKIKLHRWPRDPKQKFFDNLFMLP